MRYAVVDLGSNTIRLCVYDVAGGSIKTIVNRKQMAGLASYVEGGELTREGIDTAVRILRKQLKRAALFGPDRTDVFATAVLRNIKNSKRAVATISEQAGAPIVLLSDADEAHLGFVGASSATAMESGVLIDIGGGSSEVTRVRKGSDVARASVPQGSLSSFEAFVSDILPTADEAAAIRRAFRERYAATLSAAHVAAGDFRSETLFGIGGSVRAVAEVCGQLRPNCDGKTLTCEDVLYLCTAMLTDRRSFVHAVLRVAPERLHTVACGLFILAELFELAGGRRLTVCKNGLREGYLIERMLGGSLPVAADAEGAAAQSARG